MVPLADMSNHRDQASDQTEWGYCKKRKIFYLKSLVDIKKGDEINLCYGKSRPNTEWFFSYGFIQLPNNARAEKI